MRAVVAFLALFVSTILSLTTAIAALQFQSQSTTDGLRFIVATGEFEIADDLRLFERLVASNRTQVVTFNSPGGNVAKALELGRLIRRLGLSTVQVRNFQCASACALAFLGGVTREAEPGSIGVHQSSFEDSGISTDQAVSGIQRGTAEIITYLIEMGVDPGLLEVALSYQTNDMRYLSGSEMGHYRVTTSEQSAGSALASAPPPTSTPPVSAPADDNAKAQVEQDVLNFVRRVVSAHMRSQPEALPTFLDSYGDFVQYYGKRTPWLDVMRDKEHYFKRWPQRVYRLRDQSVSVQCRVFACDVSGVYDWAVQSLPRNKKASGTASFHYVIDTSRGLRIIDESSQILSR